MVAAIEEANGVATMNFDKGATSPAACASTGSTSISTATIAPTITDWRELTEAAEDGTAASVADTHIGSEASGQDGEDGAVVTPHLSFTNANGDSSGSSSDSVRPSFPVDPDQDVIQIMAVCAFKDPNGYLPVSFKLLATGDLPAAKLGHGRQGYYERGQRADDTAGSVNKEDLDLLLRGKKAEGGDDPGNFVDEADGGVSAAAAAATAAAAAAATARTGSATASNPPHHLNAVPKMASTAACTVGPIQEFICQLKAPTASAVWPGPSVSEVTLGIATTFTSRPRPRPNLVFETQLPPLNEVSSIAIILVTIILTISIKSRLLTALHFFLRPAHLLFVYRYPPPGSSLLHHSIPFPRSRRQRRTTTSRPQT